MVILDNYVSRVSEYNLYCSLKPTRHNSSVKTVNGSLALSKLRGVYLAHGCV